MVNQQSHRLFQKRQLVGLVHGTGHVQQKYQVAPFQLAPADLAALEADSGQPVIGIPRRIGDLNVHRKRIGSFRRRIVVREVVQQLLDPDCIRRRHLAVLEVPPHVGVRRRIHIDGEGGQRVVRHTLELVLADRSVRFGVEVSTVEDHAVIRTGYSADDRLVLLLGPFQFVLFTTRRRRLDDRLTVRCDRIALPTSRGDQRGALLLDDGFRLFLLLPLLL